MDKYEDENAFREYALKEYHSYVVRHDFPGSESETYNNFCEWIEWTNHGLKMLESHKSIPDIVEFYLKNLYHAKLAGKLLN